MLEEEAALTRNTFKEPRAETGGAQTYFWLCLPQIPRKAQGQSCVLAGRGAPVLYFASEGGTGGHPREPSVSQPLLTHALHQKGCSQASAGAQRDPMLWPQLTRQGING